MVLILEVSSSLTIRRVFVRHLVVLVRIHHAFETGRWIGWTVVSVTCCGLFGRS